MVSRAAQGAFASALVFPGGTIDPEDRDDSWRSSVDDFDVVPAAERALRIGAIREVWEETGVLVSPQRAPARTGRSFREALQASGLRLQLESLTHFGHWITPNVEAKRFDTYFFLAAAGRECVAVPDGVETLGAEWLAPARAVELARSGKRPIIFPTMLNLLRLAESQSTAEAIAAARARPHFTVAPAVEMLGDGSSRITIPPEAGYPVLEWTHRR